MTTGALETELHEIGQQLNRWQAQRWAIFTGAAVFVALAVAAVVDIFGHLERPGRLVAGGLVALLVVAGLVVIGIVLATRRTPEAVAARVEHCFPQLDNHLINVVQFARQTAADQLVRNYVRRGVPEWSGLDRRQLKNRRLDRYAYIALGAAAVVLTAPALWTGPAWGNALARVLNPWSARPASTLAQILDLQPGDRVVTTGLPVTFSCRVTGKRGQDIWLDFWPVDDRPSSVKLGQIGQASPVVAAAEPAPGQTVPAGEEFIYALPKITSDLQYRLRAGDARSPKHQITVRAPLALTAATLEIKPPAYTKLPTKTVDALAENPTVFQGAAVTVRVRGNRLLRSATIAGQQAAAAGEQWAVTLPTFAGKMIPVSITAADGENLDADLGCALVPDRAPQVKIIAPLAKTTLTPGATPTIQFEVSDDFGVSKVALQTVAGETIQEWPAQDQPQFAALWTGPGIGAGKTISYRLVVWDQGHRIQSPTIVFDTMNGPQLLAAAARHASETATTLAQLLALQRQNLERTVQLRGQLPQAPAAQWNPLRDTQTNIRQLAALLLDDPRKPLGSLGPLVLDLHRTAMAEAVDALDRVPKSGADQQTGFADQAIVLENQILRALANARDSISRIEQHRQISGLLALLDALVSGQVEVSTATKLAHGDPTKLAAGLAHRQDALAGDVSQFIQACGTEAPLLEKTDAGFAQLVRQVAEGCGTRNVGPNMLRAAERLEQQKPTDAGPFQDQALAALRDFQRLLNEWRIEQARETMNEVKKAVEEAAKKFDKLVKLQARVVDALRELEPTKDLSKPEASETREELKELKENIADAALKIATDLHIFPELPVGNELVADITQVFEEVKQTPGSESAAADELGLQKEDFILEMMESIKERFDDMEMWLTAAPDAMKRLTENFDQTEMPKMAKIPMPEELEDVIGELMDQEEEIKDKSDDSATNQALPDSPMGWDVMEGEWSNFSGKGKSGNERPDHRDQDGRSLVGRQGMSDGETVAGSGKVNEGDENIEARRTADAAQAGKVQEEGHAEAKATGGGKLSGYAEEKGMAGKGPRRDSEMAPSELGMQAMLRREAESLYAHATALHIRTGSLDEVVTAMRDAEQALRDKRPIQQVKEFQKRAVAALKKTQADLNAGFSTEDLASGPRGSALSDQTAGVPEEAPPGYRDLVAEYFKSLGSAP